MYYGLSVQSVVLGGNKYGNFIMVSIGEIPAVALTYILLQRVGRRYTLSSSMVVAGIVCVLSEIIPDTDSSGIIRLLLFFVGKCAISVSFYVLYVYTTELYPTFLRQSLMGLCSAFGFIGSMLAPQTPLLVSVLLLNFILKNFHEIQFFFQRRESYHRWHYFCLEAFRYCPGYWSYNFQRLLT